MPILKQPKKIKHPLLLLYTLFIISLGISYAYLSTTLRIEGIASIEGFTWPEEVLPALPEKPETGTGSQISDNFQSEYLQGDTIASNVQDRFENVEESYDIATSTYTLNITKSYKFGQMISRDTEDFNLNFTIKNLSNVTWENGEVSVDYESNGNLLSNVTGTIDKTTLAPNDTTTLNMKFTLVVYGQFIVSYTDKITYKINYLVDGEIKTTTVILNFVS